MSITDTQHGAGRIALVTGAAGTMGGVVARGLIDAGYRVVAADVRQADVERAARKIGSETYPIAFDVSDYDACRTAADTIRREVGDPSVLVNNAGILAQNKVAGTTPEEWRRVMSINLDGAFFLSQLCLPAMIAQGWGRIVNTSSYAAKSGGITAGTAYSVSKAALIGLTFSLAAETTKTGVTVNAIAPAYVRTPMVDRELSDEQRAEVIRKFRWDATASRRSSLTWSTFWSHPLQGSSPAR